MIRLDFQTDYHCILDHVCRKPYWKLRFLAAEEARLLDSIFLYPDLMSCFQFKKISMAD
ncbi:hypothetical protein Bca101_009849 [Brassica carinata]